MKNLILGLLAVATGVYVEKKFNVSDKIADQIKKYTGRDIFPPKVSDPE